MVLTWAVAGWFLAVRGLVQKDEKRTLPQPDFIHGFNAGSSGLERPTCRPEYAVPSWRKRAGRDMIALELQPLITADDIVLTSSGFEPAFWYYFDRVGIPQNTIVNPDLESDWQNLYLIVDDRYEETPADLWVGDLSDLDGCGPDTLQTVFSYGHYQVYVCHQP